MRMVCDVGYIPTSYIMYIRRGCGFLRHFCFCFTDASRSSIFS